MDVVDDVDDMLLDAASTQDSQESLARQFEDLSAHRIEIHPEASNSNASGRVLVDRNSTAQLHVPETEVCSAQSLEPPDTRELGKLDVIAKIEAIFESIVDGLLGRQDTLRIPISSRKARSRTILDNAGHASSSKTNTSREIHFPGKNSQEAWRFTVVFRILELLHHALTNGIVLSKRDIYYRDPNLFTKQEIVDRYTDDIACTFEVPRSSLNVTATAKGLAAGALELHRHDGSIISGNGSKEGILVPHLKEIHHVSMIAIEWVLVIEKEATFRSIINTGASQSLLSNGIIITAKGYPDLATRAFLRALVTPSSWNMFNTPKAYALVDYDPDGIGILSNYKYGSHSLAHENVGKTIDDIRWLGLTSSQVITDQSLKDDQQSLIVASIRDRRKASCMLEHKVFQESGPEPGWRRELQVMLILNVKAEIQICDSQIDGLSAWLKTELQ